MSERTYPCTCGDTLGDVDPMCRAHFPSRYVVEKPPSDQRDSVDWKMIAKEEGDLVNEKSHTITELSSSLRERDETIARLCRFLLDRSNGYHTTAGRVAGHDGKWKDCPLCAGDRALLDQAGALRASSIEAQAPLVRADETC